MHRVYGKENGMKIYRLIIVFLFLVIGILTIFLINQFYQGCERYQYYSGVLGSLLASVFAAFLVWVAWEQLGNLGKISSADFIHRLDNDFFTDETRTLVSLIDCRALEFKTNNEVESSDDSKSQPYPYFEVSQDRLDQTKLPDDLKQSLSRKKYYSTWEIDDLLLGQFENIGMLEQRRIVDFQSVYDVFSWYIETVWNDDHIKEYIKYCRDGEKSDRIDQVFYCQFQYIATKCREYNGLHDGPCIWWWKFKRCFKSPKI
jgi:hypothetical protein